MEKLWSFTVAVFYIPDLWNVGHGKGEDGSGVIYVTPWVRCAWVDVLESDSPWQVLYMATLRHQEMDRLLDRRRRIVHSHTIPSRLFGHLLHWPSVCVCDSSAPTYPSMWSLYTCWFLLEWPVQPEDQDSVCVHLGKLAHPLLKVPWSHCLPLFEDSSTCVKTPTLIDTLSSTETSVSENLRATSGRKKKTFRVKVAASTAKLAFGKTCLQPLCRGEGVYLVKSRHRISLTISRYSFTPL